MVWRLSTMRTSKANCAFLFGFLQLCLGIVWVSGCGGTPSETIYETNVFAIDETADGGDSDAMRAGTTASRGWSGQVELKTQSNASATGIQAVFPEADSYTLQFGVLPPIEGSGIFRCVATITWMNQGNTLTRQMDVVNGGSITGFGTGVTVSLADKTPNYGQG